MCLGIPGKLVEINGDVGKIDLSGVRREIRLSLVEDVQIGDYVLVHAGFAIQKLDEDEALKTLALIREMAEATDPQDGGNAPPPSEE